jgi:hypothetical protein
LLVPAQDGGWCDQKSAAAASGQQSGEGGDDGAVGPVDPRSRCASLQDGQLMAQDEDLDLVGGVGAGVEPIQLSSFVNTGRSVSPPSADHALTPSAMNRLLSVGVRRLGHPQAQEDGVDVGEIDREDGVGVRAEELRPGRANRRGAGSSPASFTIFQTVEAAAEWPSPTNSP